MSAPALRHAPQREAVIDDREAAFRLFQTAGRLQQLYAGVVEPHGISYQQYNVLRVLRSAGTGGMPTLAIRDQLAEPAPGITHLLDRLCAAGLVVREHSAADRRQIICHLTSTARALLRRLDAPIRRADAAAFGALSEAEKHALIRVLDLIRHAGAPTRAVTVEVPA